MSSATEVAVLYEVANGIASVTMHRPACHNTQNAEMAGALDAAFRRAPEGACIASGLLLAWVCDLIIASEDAVFSNPIVRMGIPSIEIFSYAYELHPRIAKEFLFLGERMSAQRAYQMGMVNRIVPRHFLEEEAYCMAARIAQMPAPGLALAKQAVNRMEGFQGTPATAA